MRKKEYIGQYLRERQVIFQRGHPICISAPPDSGKTTFILQDICRKAREENQRVVLLVNRKALFAETRFKMLCSELRQYITDGHLQIIEIQNLETTDEKAEKIKGLVKSCDIICIDEAHYFVSDALFNPRTEISFDFLTGLIKSHILIFMSATPENFFRAMRNRFEEIFEGDCRKYDEENQLYQNRVEEMREQLYFEKTGHAFDDSLSAYCAVEEELERELVLSGCVAPEPPRRMELEIIDCIEPDYSYFDISHYSKLEDLTSIVEKSKGKWLIFVDSKKKGKKLKKKLEVLSRQKRMQISIGFVDTDYRRDAEAYDIVDLITKAGELKVDILITTSTLDNGINITDSKLQHVVIMSFGRTQFIQMVNRKRVRNGERVNLYLCNGSEGVFLRKKYREVFDYEAIREIANQEYIASTDKILMDEKLLRLKDVLFYRLDSSQWKLSRLSLLALQIEYNFVADVAKKMQTDPFAFLRMQYQWLGLEFSEKDVCKDVRVGQQNVEKVRLMLEGFSKMECLVWTMEDFNKIAGEVLNLLGEKTNQKPIQRLNNTLKTYPPLRNYFFSSQHNRNLGTYYTLGEWRYPKLNPEYQDVESVKVAVRELQDYQVAFQILFGAAMPEFFRKNQEYAKEYVCKALKNSKANWYLKSKSNGYLEAKLR